MHGQKLAEFCREYAEAKKAEEVVILDVREVSSVTDFFVIASATSEPHVRAIWNEIVDSLKQEHGVSASKPEGISSNN